jgi:hypothetical protein
MDEKKDLVLHEQTALIDQSIINEFAKQFTSEFYQIATQGELAIRQKIQSVADYFFYLIEKGFMKESDWESITTHHFAPSIYIREVRIPKDQIVVGKIHKHDHWNYILRGSVTVLTKDGATRYEAPIHMLTTAGTQRLLYTHEDTVWVVVHPNPTDTHDLKEIEAEHIAKDYSDFPLHEKEKKD